MNKGRKPRILAFPVKEQPPVAELRQELFNFVIDLEADEGLLRTLHRVMTAGEHKAAETCQFVRIDQAR